MNSKEETIIERAIKLGEQKVLTYILHGNIKEIVNFIEDFQEKYYDIDKKDCDCLDCISEVPTPCKYKQVSLEVLEENSLEELKKIIKC